MVEGDAIAAFYEAHPYPPPVDDLDAYRDRWDDDSRRRAEFHRHFPERAFTDDLNILVAGCGTSQAARHALRWPGGRVTGIDVSEASLDATDRLRERYSLENLSLRRLPIERAAELEDEFDLVICTGVLHHLSDPDGGLRNLVDVLTPAGVLHLMVYGRFGRTGTTMMREYARMLDVEPTIADINDLASTLREIPMDHPLSPLLRTTPDFRTPGALADALLNPRERTYSVPELLELLEGNDLRFDRWHHQAPYRPRCGMPATTPHAGRLAELPEPDQYAAMELLRGSMARHTVLARRTESQRPPSGAPITRAVVPILLPDVVIVEERLPEGAAAVVINTAHSYTDLVRPITPAEKKVVDLIDGSRTAGEIATTVASGGGRADAGVMRLLEDLWLWDHIVTDRSQESQP